MAGAKDMWRCRGNGGQGMKGTVVTMQWKQRGLMVWWRSRKMARPRWKHAVRQWGYTAQVG
eukprot:11195458-Lingulodinium_polyedra.AAC.1